jgi:deazaflavin-dependent oxidoreductase (nitroreductase family)
MSFITESLSRLKRWLYKGQRPNGIARLLNRWDAMTGALGLSPNYMETLEVVGRKSGKPVSLPVVVTTLEGERYLVSMLGEDVQWVRNVRAAKGKAVLVSGRREEVVLEEVRVERRAPILKAYLLKAPGARAHVPVNKDAALEEFEKVAAAFPVFRIAGQTQSEKVKTP